MLEVCKDIGSGAGKEIRESMERQKVEAMRSEEKLR